MVSASVVVAVFAGVVVPAVVVEVVTAFRAMLMVMTVDSVVAARVVAVSGVSRTFGVFLVLRMVVSFVFVSVDGVLLSCSGFI